ncbi:hypothetical protein NUU61_001565 [Penicillium alfredii]|uniref:Uncharacterized protein n=1 Tax=Penicillium alfredii TaxID=1506179 RepID=A0A9W9G486_9EURO|nr:uncharacterized protein NUU61_001308 [Penicillium alfredii]XP_056515414.1 uncharacterized protein NUU61_001565 [Penicillium alfredii]KAJ5111678.1 hypothetical protein NUU61_001308 [Penicillium alfredii]KAJ5111935.1 hypothetical protein NUU61_001565 [Penicillium alfredii]
MGASCIVGAKEQPEEREAPSVIPGKVENENNTPHNRAENIAQTTEHENRNSAEDPFQPVFQILQQLEQEDPKLASQGARLLGLYRRM